MQGWGKKGTHAAAPIFRLAGFWRVSVGHGVTKYKIQEACRSRLLWKLWIQFGNRGRTSGLMINVFHSGLHLRPSYCAGSYGPVRIKVSNLQPVDAREKARRLQSISLRYHKSP